MSVSGRPISSMPSALSVFLPVLVPHLMMSGMRLVPGMAITALPVSFTVSPVNEFFPMANPTIGGSKDRWLKKQTGARFILPSEVLVQTRVSGLGDVYSGVLAASIFWIICVHRNLLYGCDS